MQSAWVGSVWLTSSKQWTYPKVEPIDERIENIQAVQEEKAISPQISAIQKEAWLQKEAETNPNDVQARQEMAKHYSQHGKFKNALAEYQKMLEVDPLSLSPSGRGREPRWGPKNAEAHFSLAILYMSQDAHKKSAIAHLQKVLEIEPSHPKKTGILLWLNALQNESAKWCRFVKNFAKSWKKKLAYFLPFS